MSDPDRPAREETVPEVPAAEVPAPGVSVLDQAAPARPTSADPTTARPAFKRLPPRFGGRGPVGGGPRERIEILVDADACPVKDEIYKVAGRHGIAVAVVAHGHIRVPAEPLIRFVRVAEGFNAADDWIAERARPGLIVITTDVPLAHRALGAGAAVVQPTGRILDEASIGMALATRDLMEDLRSGGEQTGGARPFSARDRSTFLSALDTVIMWLKRAGHPVA